MSYIGKTVFHQSSSGIPSGEYFVVAERGQVLSVIGHSGEINEIPTERLAAVEFDPDSAASLADELEEQLHFASATLIRKTLNRLGLPSYQELSNKLTCAEYTIARLVQQMENINHATVEALVG
jgi:hypothetical protein